VKNIGKLGRRQLELKTSKILSISGGAVAILGAVLQANERSHCDQGFSWSTGLIGAFDRLNRELREQACLQEATSSPSFFVLVAGFIVLAVGVTNWIRVSRPDKAIPATCSGCDARIEKGSPFCANCGKPQK